MSTIFPNLSNGQTIDESHVDRYTLPVQSLESGASWYRDDIGTTDAYKVSFAGAINPVTAYTPGLLVHFKADSTNTGAATLTIAGPSGDITPAVNLRKTGNVALDVGDIREGQVIAAVYTDSDATGGARFEVLGGLSSGGGAAELNDLTDVVISSPASGQVMRHDGTNFVNAALAAPDIGAGTVSNTEFGYLDGVTSAIQTQLDGKASSTHTHALDDLTDVAISSPASGQVVRHNGTNFVNAALAAPDIGAGSVSDTEFGYLDGVTSAIQTQLDGKQDQADPLDEISSLTMTKGDILVHDGTELNKLDVGANGEMLAADSAEATGLKWVAASGGATDLDDLTDVVISSPASGQVLRHNGTNFVNVALAAPDIGAGTVSDTEFGYLDGVTSAIQTQIDGKASSTHTHALDDLTDVAISSPASGQVVRHNGTNFVNAALAAPDIGAGTVSNTEFGYLDGVTSAIQTQLDSKQGLNAKLTDIAGITLNKGDVLTTDGTNIKDLAVGTNGQVLTADSAAANGIKWATPTAGSIDLDGLTDVVIASPANGQVLRHNGTNFVNAALAASDIVSGTFATARIPTGISAGNISGGTVSNTEFDYLNGLTSGIQSQLSGKAASIHTHAASDITSGILAVARIPTGISAANINTGNVSNTEFGYLNGVTSALQTQLNDKISNPSSGQIQAPSFFSTTGYYYGKNSGTAQTFMPQVRNFGAGQLMYWVNTSPYGEVVYQFSRGAHKEEVKTLSLSIDDLMRWRPVEFKWKEHFGGTPDVGLIAEEVEAVYPLATTQDQPWEYLDEKTGVYAKDENGAPKRLDGDPVVAGVKYEKAWIPMLAAVQDFYKRFQALSLEVQTLKAKLEGAK